MNIEEISKLESAQLDALEDSLIDGSNEQLLKLVYSEQFKRAIFNITKSWPVHYDRMTNSEGWRFAFENLKKLIASRKSEATQHKSGIAPARRQKAADIVRDRIYICPPYKKILADVKNHRHEFPADFSDDMCAIILAQNTTDELLDFWLEMWAALGSDLDAESVDKIIYEYAKANDIQEHAVIHDYIGYHQLERIYNKLRAYPELTGHQLPPGISSLHLCYVGSNSSKAKLKKDLDNVHSSKLLPLLIIAILALLLALFPMPYGYYTLLRIIICGVAIWTSVIAYTLKKLWAVWLFGFIAVLFNPLIPIHLDRELWAMLDILTAGIFITGIFTFKSNQK